MPRSLMGLLAPFLLGLFLIEFAPSDSFAQVNACKRTKLCEDTPAQAPAKRKDEPPRPQVSVCDRRWPGVSSSISAGELQSWLDACPTNSHAPAARQRIAGLRADAQNRADQFRRERCENILSALYANGVAYGGANTTARFNAYATECPTQAASPRGEALRQQLARWDRLDGEMTRWGINFRQMCGLGGGDLLRTVRFAERRQEIETAGGAGDSVANLLLSIDAYNKFYAWLGPLDVAWAYEKKSSDAGNPAGMAFWAGSLIRRANPDYATADALLEQSRSLGCGAGSAMMAGRLGKDQLTKPSWAGSYQRYWLLVEALNRGVGSAACRIVIDANAADSTTPLTPEQRQDYYTKATQAGSGCGKALLVMEADKFLHPFSSFGPCANKDEKCLFLELRSLAAGGNEGASELLAELALDYFDPKKHTPQDSQALFNLLRDSAVQGDSVSMATLGRGFLTGTLGFTESASAGTRWCSNAYMIGEPYGSACLGMFAGYGNSYIDHAFRYDPCAPYGTFNAVVGIDIGNQTAEQVRATIARLPKADKTRLKRWIDKMQYGVGLSALGAGVCAKDAKWWQTNWYTVFGYYNANLN